MAYFMWDNTGVRELLRAVDSRYSRSVIGNPPESFELADLLPAPVEMADIFRVIVCNTIGGVVSGLLEFFCRNLFLLLYDY